MAFLYFHVSLCIQNNFEKAPFSMFGFEEGGKQENLEKILQRKGGTKQTLVKCVVEFIVFVVHSFPIHFF